MVSSDREIIFADLDPRTSYNVSISAVVEIAYGTTKSAPGVVEGITSKHIVFHIFGDYRKWHMLNWGNRRRFHFRPSQTKFKVSNIGVHGSKKTRFASTLAVLPDSFRVMRAQRKSTGTQQLDHASRCRPEIKEGGRRWKNQRWRAEESQM